MTQVPDNARKTLILTGASRGIGHATVKRFSTAGWRVITCSRQPFPEDCPWDAGPEDHIVVDLASSDDTHAAIAQMKKKLKAQGSRLHALVNNAAISPKNAKLTITKASVPRDPRPRDAPWAIAPPPFCQRY